MFKRKKCPNCEKTVNKDWNYCPECGNELSGKRSERMRMPGIGLLFGGQFKKIVKDMERGLEDMDNDDSGIVRKGINVTISSGPDGQPIVNVGKMGAPRRPEEKPRKKRKVPKSTEEPDTIEEHKGGVKTVTISLPGVKESDIDIFELDNSIEVRAYAGDKGYFKLIPVPRRADISRSFKDGKLKIEIRR